MISRQHRFHGQKDIEQIYRKGLSVRAGFMTAKALLAQRGNYHLAVVVSRKVNKSAVVRNRIRRRLYEQFRLIAKDKPAKMKYDIVLSVYEDKLITMPAAELRQACLHILSQIEKTLSR